MRKILTLVLLLSFACSEETEFQCESCINMTISDALPIQFWKNDCPTYNEKESCGVHSFCWTQKFHCDDEIRLQLTDNVEGKEYSLQLLNQESEITSEIGFEKTDITTQSSTDPLEFSTTNLSTGFGNWQSFEGSFGASNPAWIYVGGYPGVRSGGSPLNQATRLLAIDRIDGNLWPKGDYIVRFRVKQEGGGTQGLRALVYGMQDSISEVFAGSNSAIPNDGFFHDIEVEFTFTEPFKYIAVNFANAAAPGGGFYVDAYVSQASILYSPVYLRSIYNLSFNTSEISPDLCNEKVQFQIVSDGSPEEVAKSDFVEFSDNLGCTVLAKYRNQRNFAGIDYANLPEDAYFYKRIPAVFFHEQFPGEDEQAELSDSKIIALNGVLRAQKLLDTDYMPYHEHKKNQLILKHQFVEIDGDRWTKQDAYEIAEGNKRYPLKKATCWLTNRDFVARNVI